MKDCPNCGTKQVDTCRHCGIYLPMKAELPRPEPTDDIPYQPVAFPVNRVRIGTVRFTKSGGMEVVRAAAAESEKARDERERAIYETGYLAGRRAHGEVPRIISAFRSMHGLAKRIWCKHEWRTHSSNLCSVIRGDGIKEGEVTLTVLDCCKCDASTLIPSDRIHSPSETSTNT